MSFVIVWFYHAIFDLIYFMHACDEGRFQIRNDGLFTFACKMFCIFELRSESESVRLVSNRLYLMNAYQAWSNKIQFV